MSREAASYILHYYGRLMTKEERGAYSHLVATMKATNGRSDAAAQEQAKLSRIYSKSLSNNPEVLRLAHDRCESFVWRTAARILREHEQTLSFNLCPKCGGLARTPTARQCGFCGFDWHGTM